MERIDLHAGAENMVERLTEQNLILEEKVRTLQEELRDMRSMADLAEEAIDVHRDTEASLNDELNASYHESNRLMQALYVSLSFPCFVKVYPRLFCLASFSAFPSVAPIARSPTNPHQLLAQKYREQQDTIDSFRTKVCWRAGFPSFPLWFLQSKRFVDEYHSAHS